MRENATATLIFGSNQRRAGIKSGVCNSQNAQKYEWLPSLVSNTLCPKTSHSACPFNHFIYLLISDKVSLSREPPASASQVLWFKACATHHTWPESLVIKGKENPFSVETTFPTNSCLPFFFLNHQPKLHGDTDMCYCILVSPSSMAVTYSELGEEACYVERLPCLC